MGEFRNVLHQMKLRCLLAFVVLSACGGLVSAALGGAAEAALKFPEKPLEILIQELADPQFRIREEASRRIWERGETALPALQNTVVGTDPEQAYRARELIRKIQLFLTPETDPVVIQLTERWEKASQDEKVGIFDKLNGKRAWRQILKLYASETGVDLQLRLLQPLRNSSTGFYGISGVAIIAAREKLMVNDAKSAREFLEMAPANAVGLLALAEFHRSQGNLESELKRAKTLGGHHGAAWRLALHRAAGNVEQARDAATAAGEIKIAALMSTLLGDPLPWLQKMAAEDQGIKKSYTDLAIRRWQGQPSREPDLHSLQLAASSANRIERANATSALFLLGESAPAETAYLKNSAFEAFVYYDSLERIPEALRAVGIDPEKPDFAAWVQKCFATLTQDPAGDDHLALSKSQELVIFANFLERRGLFNQCDEAFLKGMATLADSDAEAFAELLGEICRGIRRGNLLLNGAPEIAKKVAVAWVGKKDDRWDEVVAAVFGKADQVSDLLNWMAEIDPESSRGERFDGLLALAGLTGDPDQRRAKWQGLAWAAIEQTAPEKRQPLFKKMTVLVSLSLDAVTNLKFRDMQPKEGGETFLIESHLYQLSAAGRWGEVAAALLNMIELQAKNGVEPEPTLRAYAAACLRKAGRPEEAAAQDILVEKLALGTEALQIAGRYSDGGDYPHAAEWLARAVRQCDPAESEALADALGTYQTALLEGGKWKEVAAVTEVMAQIKVSLDSENTPPLAALRLRLQSDLGRALANLKNDRAGSISILRACHQFFPSDGSLADDFFPALRKMRLVKEHDEWFDESWASLTAVIAEFPDSENTYNTTAWLASRARRNLDQAEKFEEKALSTHPNQPAYLDTMAELQFAKGNRKKALDWSSRAVNFLPGDPQLRRQNERFRSEPLPK